MSSTSINKFDLDLNLLMASDSASCACPARSWYWYLLSLICEKQRVPVESLPVLVFYGKCHLGPTIWPVSQGAISSGPQVTFMKSVSDCFYQRKL